MKNIPKLFQKLLILFVITLTTSVYSQHTERFKTLVKPLKPIDSIIVVKKYRNGNPKRIETYLHYEYRDYTYKYVSGKYQVFSKNGKVFLEEEFDDFQNILIHKRFNNRGEAYKIIRTEKIDTKAKNIEDFLKSNKDLIITVYEKEFTSLEKDTILKLWKEGRRINGKKTGIWKTYNLCDDSIKLKEY